MSDMTKRFFVEPQLTNPPFRPDIVTEPKVQVPKFWGNSKSIMHSHGASYDECSRTKTMTRQIPIGAAKLHREQASLANLFE